MGKSINLVGQKFNRLLVVEKTEKRNSNGCVIWKCQCDCGNFTYLSTNSLNSGHTKSCGCYGKENYIKLGQNHLIDLTGQKFGKLTVIKRDKDVYQQGGQPRPTWFCQCECGNTTIVRGYDLRRGSTKSCGCLKTSFGEYKISQLLDKLNLSYEKEKIFKDCILPSGRPARFDFYVNNEYLIEFDGRQHFLEEAGWGKNDLKEIQKRDNFKNNYCKTHNIPLIRISYKDENHILPDDVILATTRFKFI